jgi:hypothetical protein
MGREALLMSVSPRQNFLKPPPVPEMPTVTLTAFFLDFWKSSATPSVMGIHGGRTVDLHHLGVGRQGQGGQRKGKGLGKQVHAMDSREGKRTQDVAGL